jgi:hypothetical protein
MNREVHVRICGGRRLRCRRLPGSVEEKAHVMRQIGTGKANASKPLMKRRKVLDDIKTGAIDQLRDEPGECPLIGQVVSGV